MSTYKITNITNLLNKRDSKFNMVLDIEYIDDRTKKVISVKPADTVFLTVNSLPLSVHRLRIKKMIEISEISATELAKLMEKDKPKSTLSTKPVKKIVPVEKKKVSEVSSVKKTTTGKKKTIEK